MDRQTGIPILLKHNIKHRYLENYNNTNHENTVMDITLANNTKIQLIAAHNSSMKLLNREDVYEIFTRVTEVFDRDLNA